MKKKLLIGMFAAIMLATSCKPNPGDETSDRGKTQVTITAGLEGGINNKRAISDGSQINKLHFAIFDKNNELVENINNDAASFPVEIENSLIIGEQYTIVFWAQNKDCTAFTISEDKKSVNINYEDALNNDEKFDAFFKSVTFTVTENTNINIILKRPFAQLNVGITEKEWNNAVKRGVEIKTSEVELKQAASTLNLLDGSVDTPKDVVFKANAIPTESLVVDVDLDGRSETYKYLSMCYFLPYDENGGASKTLLTDLEYTFTAQNGSEFVLSNGLENAPVQRNHRTNIISSDGNGIITGDINVKVSLDALYDGEHTLDENYVWENYLGIYTEEALEGETIYIPSNWLIRNGYILEPMPEYWNASSSPLYTKPYTIDGQNNTITFEPYNYQFIAKNAFAATDGQLVTVKDIVFEGEHFGIYGGVYGGAEGRTNYKTHFENVQIVNNGIYCYNVNGNIPMSAFSNLGEATLNNCKIDGSYWVGATKDENVNAQNCFNTYGEAYDIFIPNNSTTTLTNSEIGRIYVNNHATFNAGSGSIINQIISKPLVNGTITIEAGAEVTSMNIDQHSNTYPPKVNIKSGATVETLDLNSIKKTKINIEDGAIIGKIIWNGNEYTSIEDFKNA